MDISRFEHSPVGHLVPITVSQGERTWHHHAFVPDRLPDEVKLSSASLRAVIAATAAVNRLDGAAKRLPNPLLLSRPAFYEEAVSTSALEGTYATIDEVFEADLLEPGELSPAVAEVRNYVAATMHGIELVKELPVCRRLLLEVHKTLMTGGRGDHLEAGRVRERQNWIGNRRSAPITEAIFVPPPHGEVLEDGVGHWEEWINHTETPILIRVALGHYLLETLHPFIDGNGRIGRLVAMLQLIANGDLTVPLLNISPYLEERKDEYLGHLRSTSETGDWAPWVEFFCEAVRHQSERALARAESLISTGEALVRRVREANLRGVAVQITEQLVGFPVISATHASKDFDTSYQAANRAIGNLVEIGVLREVTGKSYGRLFACTEVLELLTGQPRREL